MAGPIRVTAFVTKMGVVHRASTRAQFVYAHGAHTTSLGIGAGRGGSKLLKITNIPQSAPDRLTGVRMKRSPGGVRTFVESSRRRVVPYNPGSASLIGPTIETRNRQWGMNRPITPSSRARLARLTRGFRNAGASRSKYSLYV